MFFYYLFLHAVFDPNKRGSKVWWEMEKTQGNKKKPKQ